MNVFDPSNNSHGMVVPGSQPAIHAHDTKILGRSFCSPKQWEKANGILSRLKRLRSFVSAKVLDGNFICLALLGESGTQQWNQWNPQKLSGSQQMRRFSLSPMSRSQSQDM